MQINDFEPKSLWQHFDEICKIPRCSGDEERARQYVLAFAQKRNFEAKTDDTGNVVISVPASAGHDNAPVVAIQGHLDMVCEKNSGVEHDFTSDPIDVEVDGEWLTANGTTLGADNGIGVAAALACADDDSVEHGPLELLFTVDEEVGLTGAGKLEAGWLHAKYLLNLDSEELGELYIGCAGGGDSTIRLPVSRTKPAANTVPLAVHVSGLRGGHSGMDIVEQRGNAIKILARTLWEASRDFDVAMTGADGGNKRNAIPREARSTVFIDAGSVDAFKSGVAALRDAIAAELGGRENELAIDVSEGEGAEVLAADSCRRLLDLLMGLPHGVQAMSYDIDGLVETSNNLATVVTNPEMIQIGTSSRSSINSALQTVRDCIASIARLAGAEVEEDEAYPGWKPDLSSDLLRITQKVHGDALGTTPEPKAIHAGLECGIIGEKYPGLDMISFGPTIQHPHSPNERINVASVDTFWGLLKGVLKELSAR